MDQRRTKIVATIGPTSSSSEVLEAMMSAGLDMVRMNFSHGSPDDHRARIDLVRSCAKKVGRIVGILADLQGPKIRIARFRDGKIQLNAGDRFALDAELDVDAGTKKSVGIDYKDLPKDVSPNDTLLLDDGRLSFRVESVEGCCIKCQVIAGGILSNNKGINRLGGGLSAQALTNKDKADLKVAVAAGVDYIAVSFPRDAADVEEAKQLIHNAGGTAGVIAKIERAEAVTNINDIIAVADGVMVARGDLAVEIGEAEVPGVQKQIIAIARDMYKPVIIATQMMESMTEKTMPTRAEVSDVANAVLDQTDAVMLSAETAIGKHPVRVIETMAKVCESAEKFQAEQNNHPQEREFKLVDQAIASATVYTANHMHPKAIIALTESGSTPLMMSRIRSDIPIFGLSRNFQSCTRMTLYRDVFPIEFDATKYSRGDVNQKAVEELVKRNIVKTDDLVILTKGDTHGVHGGTNAMKVIVV